MARTPHPTTTELGWSDQTLSRRSLLRLGLVAAAAAPLATACGTVQRIWPGAGRLAGGSKSSDKRLRVVQTRDFHPDHNAFVEQKIRDFAAQKGYDLDHS